MIKVNQSCKEGAGARHRCLGWAGSQGKGGPVKEHIGANLVVKLGDHILVQAFSKGEGVPAQQGVRQCINLQFFFEQLNALMVLGVNFALEEAIQGLCCLMLCISSDEPIVS